MQHNAHQEDVAQEEEDDDHTSWVAPVVVVLTLLIVGAVVVVQIRFILYLTSFFKKLSFLNRRTGA